MKLSRVKIVGFKTFADRTEFELNGNIIAVVGPNGCGKSNIVDAILWGLGESNARNLRAQNSQEVIFNGTQKRKPLGYAEVTLVFDNEDGSLPIPSAEVSITRKLNRNGDSDYFINRRACRLRDVTELLADSGLGRAGYAIVGQSDIDQALAASAEQRRAWIDEAAGVQRYRMRRSEAMRKLQQCSENLSRVSDVIAETERLRAPLEAEAVVARRYKELLGSLRAIELAMLVREYQAAEVELSSMGRSLDENYRVANENKALIDSFEEDLATVTAKIDELDQELEKLRAGQRTAQSEYEQARTLKEVAETRLLGLDTLEQSLQNNAQETQGRLEELTGDLETATAEAEEARTLRESLRASLAGVGEEAKRLTKELRELESELAKARKETESHHRLKLEQEHQLERKSKLELELAGIKATLPDLEKGLAEASAACDEAEAHLAELQKKRLDIESSVVTLKADEDVVQSSLRNLLADLARQESKSQALEAIIQSNEGLTHGAKAVMARVESGILPDVFVPVGNAIETDADLAIAVETALGNAINDLIVPDESYAKEAIQALKADRAGRATFQPISLMRPVQRGNDFEHVLRQRGIVGVASELVSTDPRFRPVIDSLLGKIIVVETLEDALALGRTNGWSRLVTLDGEVIFQSGAVTGGVNSRQPMGNVQRRAELLELEHALDAIRVGIAKEEEAQANINLKRANVQAETEELRKLEIEYQPEVESARNWLHALKLEHSSTLRSADKIQGELDQLGLFDVLPPLEHDLELLQAKRDDAMKLLAASSSDSASANAKLTEADQRLAQAESRKGEAYRRLQNAKIQMEQRQRQSSEIGPERAQYQQQKETAEQRIKTFEARVTEFRARYDATNKERLTTFEKKTECEKSVADFRSALAILNENNHRIEIQRARADARKAASVSRMLEEYGVGPEEAVETTRDQELPDDAAQVVATLRREIKSMGEVNLGAVEAFERLDARYSELVAQVADIEEGKRDVEASIRELDRLTRDRFVTTFDALKVAFAETFRSIFGDGEGVIELVESENILDSGVEISVQVPGKRKQRLELLSGGERALAATAFLFALLKVKPTPLVVLDEIDAPLDGRNVERFITAMRSFAESIQFILITHNPVTIECADVWFGVTMQEPGVSTLVPVRIPDKTIVKAVVPDAFLKG